MGFFDRVKRIVKSNVNSVLDRVEDPEHAINEALDGMTGQFAGAKETLAQMIVDEKKLERTVEADEAESGKLRQRAAQLVAAGKDAAAKEALTLHRTVGERVTLKKQALENQRVQIQQMRDRITEMGRRIEEARAKRGELLARMKSASTASMISGEPETNLSAFQEFDKFAQGVEDAETRAKVMQELSGQPTSPELENLKAPTNDVDDELARLKAELDKKS